jgi:hypothetical protein
VSAAQTVVAQTSSIKLFRKKEPTDKEIEQRNGRYQYILHNIPQCMEIAFARQDFAGMTSDTFTVYVKYMIYSIFIKMGMYQKPHLLSYSTY